jgi:hypothetical protein
MRARAIPALTLGTTLGTGGGILGQTTDWNMISALISSVGVLLTAIALCFLIYDSLRPERRKRKLTKPAEAYFIIPSCLTHSCDYAYQNEFTHKLKEIIIPANNEIIIDIIITPLMSFTSRAVYFGCHGDNPHTKPRPLEYVNQFILQGNRRHVVPGKGNDDYVTNDNFYYVVETRYWSEGINGIMGFKICTGPPGKYQAKLYFAGEWRMGEIDDLSIVVSEEPRKLMYCIDRHHAHMNCAAGIKYRASP